MRHTVIGLFNTYAEADGARNALVQSGFAYHEVELRANPETASDAIADESPGVLANIERFFSSLFSTSGSSLNEPIAERYTDAVRRGAVLVAVDATSDAHTELAHNMLMRLGARDVSERARFEPPPPRDAGETAQARREHSMLDELGLGTPAAVPTAAQPPNEALRAMEEERRYERVDAPPHDTPIDDEAARTAIAAGSAPGSGAVLRPDLADTADAGRRELDEAAMREAQMREQQVPHTRMTQVETRSDRMREAQMQRDTPAAPLAPSSPAPSAPPRDEFSRISGGASSSMGDEPAYPARTVRGAAQYQSDPADISRATPLPGEGLWQRDMAAERSSRTGSVNPRYPEPAATPQGVSPVRDEHQPPQMMPDADLSSDMTGVSGRDKAQREVRGAGMPDERSVERNDDRMRGSPAAASTPGMMNEHEAREQLRGADRGVDRGVDYSQPTVGNDAPRRTSDDTRGPDLRAPTPSATQSPYQPSSQTTSEASPTTSTASAASQQAAARNARDGDLGAPIPDEFLEYEEDFRLHYDEQFGTREGARYDEYVPAYRYGATMGRDTRYQDRPWDDDVELDARHDWERAAPEGSWDRFKAAVRHGWERVTGHPHHH